MTASAGQASQQKAPVQEVSDPTAPAVQVSDLVVSFALGRGTRLRRGARREGRRLVAVDHVDLELPRGQALGLVGESGCGKTTLGRAIVGQIQQDSGTVAVDGREQSGRRSRADQRRIQMVFQDPMSSLNPKLKIGGMLAELLKVHDMVPHADIAGRIAELLSSVGLPAGAADIYPDTLSGGQRQRVSIARALALSPDVLVADEITSALDVSIQAQVLSLLLELKQRLGLTVLFISHNLAVIRQMCDQVAVMYLGRIVEQGPTEQIFTRPEHPYTRLLLSSIPRLDAVNLGENDGESTAAPSGADRAGAVGSAGCRFRDRCPQAEQLCADAEPALLATTAADHLAACHFSSGR